MNSAINNLRGAFFSHSILTCTYEKKSFIIRNRFSHQFKRFHSSMGKHLAHSSTNVNGEDLPQLFSVAPMMDWTDNHYRTLARLISTHAWLYTEMVVAETIVHQKDNLDRFLAFSPIQHPIVLQIGGSNLKNLAKATELANAYSYDEINLNCGCPSGKVAGHGCFGARLMYDPKFVGDAMSAIASNCDVPVSVKCRIGVDDRDSYNELCDFIHTVVSRSPTAHFIIHARKALLSGLSPAENRNVPPLNPWNTLGQVDSEIYGASRIHFSRRQVLEKYQIYGDSELGKYGPNKPNIRQIVKPLLHLFHSEPGNGLWKRKADTAMRHCTTIESFLEETLDAIPDSVLDSTLPIIPPEEEGVFFDKTLLPPPYKSCQVPGLCVRV
ncbi:tRNA-dihydrouridine(20/20a) synthase-like isoform X3 [Zingiber officinale]|uniref:tRNA-dihydrouridine(20/20a) synthase-like isoform X3 n=1 Tax=Zingiber officinale TaxID=94328 RepID=UPI001C4C08AA|nr:tRNA-dihydrouridine(20/20a) synthase-like isoform X3 [Zingiber officinale]